MADQNIELKKLKDENKSLIESFDKVKDNMIASEEFRADQSIVLKKLGKDNKLLSEGLNNFEEKYKNIGKCFERARDENATEVEELTSTILSMKKRCKKLQYDS